MKKDPPLVSEPSAVLVFQLNDPQSKKDLELAMAAGALQCVIWEMDQSLRNKVKHIESTESRDLQHVFQMVRNELWNEIKERDLERFFP